MRTNNLLLYLLVPCLQSQSYHAGVHGGNRKAMEAGSYTSSVQIPCLNSISPPPVCVSWCLWRYLRHCFTVQCQCWQQHLHSVLCAAAYSTQRSFRRCACANALSQLNSCKCVFSNAQCTTRAHVYMHTMLCCLRRLSPNGPTKTFWS